MSYRRAINLNKNQEAIRQANAEVPVANTRERRRQWMDAYIAAGGEYEEVNPSGRTASDVEQSCCVNLTVTVKDATNGDLLEGVTINIAITEEKEGITNANGQVQFQVKKGPYSIEASLEGYRTASTSVNAINELNEVELELKSLILRENIIFIGSELSYDSFWLKMMFVAPGFSMGDKGIKLRLADKNTIAFIDVGYTRAEKLALEYLKDQRNFNIISISNITDIINHINNRPEEQKDNQTEKTLIQDVAFFCHGLPGKLALNYKGEDINITTGNLSSMNADVFLTGGRIYSYACRTGVSKWEEEFDNDEAAEPENSLAQKMADHFNVDVYAFLTRTYYGDSLREKDDSKRISDTLKEARQTQEGQIIDIPPDHEGLPHPGLAEGGWFSSTDEEGTNEYALWRKKGAIKMPSAHTTPKGLSQSMQRFTPTG